MTKKIEEGDLVQMKVAPFVIGIVEYIYDGAYVEEAVLREATGRGRMNDRGKVYTGTQYLRLIKTKEQMKAEIKTREDVYSNLLASM